MFFTFKNNKDVEIVDSCMGTYKSTYTLEWMDSNPQYRYIFVSPLLSEIEEGGRVQTALKNIDIVCPSSKSTTKSEDLLKLLKDGRNIACTHALYSSITDAHLNEISIKNYIIIIDEELDVIGGFDQYSSSDVEWLLSKGDVSISDSDGMVSWVGDKTKISETHKYYDFLRYCESRTLYSTKRSETMMVTQLPIRLFECASRVIILTYMFDNNVLDCFLKLKGFNVKKCLDIKPKKEDKELFKTLLTVIPPSQKLKDYKLNSTWWAEANGDKIKDVKNYIETTGRRLGVTGDDVLWTAPKHRVVKDSKQNKILLKPRKYIVDSNGDTCYLASNARATNIYRNKSVLFHLYNRYPLVPVKAYLQDYGCRLDQNVFALSQLLQWAWRGCIRDSKPMTLCIGSDRMYWLFMNWLYGYGVSPVELKGKSYK